MKAPILSAAAVLLVVVAGSALRAAQSTAQGTAQGTKGENNERLTYSDMGI